MQFENGQCCYAYREQMVSQGRAAGHLLDDGMKADITDSLGALAKLLRWLARQTLSFIPILTTPDVQGDHLSRKPGNVYEFATPS